MTKPLTYTPTTSPLMQWWQHNAPAIDAACTDATATIEQARQLRAVLDRAARGDLPIDDADLRLVLGYLGVGRPEVAEVIRRHRQWEAQRCPPSR